MSTRTGESVRRSHLHGVTAGSRVRGEKGGRAARTRAAAFARPSLGFVCLASATEEPFSPKRRPSTNPHLLLTAFFRPSGTPVPGTTALQPHPHSFLPSQRLLNLLLFGTRPTSCYPPYPASQTSGFQRVPSSKQSRQVILSHYGYLYPHSFQASPAAREEEQCVLLFACFSQPILSQPLLCLRLR